MKKFIRSKSWISTSTADEMLLMNVDDGSFRGLNESGAILWVLLEHEQNIPSLTNALAETYETTAENVEFDISAFVHELLDCGALIEFDGK